MALPAEIAAPALLVIRRWATMTTLATAAQKHHSDVSSWVVIHNRNATATTFAMPRTAMARWLEIRREAQQANT